MRAAPFDCHSPSTLLKALRLLDELDGDARPLAGGQSLIPLLNHRLVRPRHLVDLNALAELDFVREEDGWLAIGALTRYSEIERSPLVQHSAPLLAAAHFESPSPNPVGFNGLGEGGTIGAPAAVVNAVADALTTRPVRHSCWTETPAMTAVHHSHPLLERGGRSAVWSGG
jgi:xanthine dehydrogenase iron-sulfur cluster and FAD-binding subunit A